MRIMQTNPLLADIRRAIEANRIELYLQPIVTLPQRKVRYYEAMSRLRTEHGDLLHAADFVAAAESGGLMPKIDNLVVFRCVQVVRRLLLKNREIGLFCNVSGLDAHRPQSSRNFSNSSTRTAPLRRRWCSNSRRARCAPWARSSTKAWRRSPNAASASRSTTSSTCASSRASSPIATSASSRFRRASCSTARVAKTDIHPADLSDLVGRFGIDLIAEKIESEGSVVDLLDCDVRFGQGFLFSPPRPVRAEALQGISERSDVIARDAAPPDDQARRRHDAADSGTRPEAGPQERVSGLAQLARGIVSRR